MICKTRPHSLCLFLQISFVAHIFGAGFNKGINVVLDMYLNLENEFQSACLTLPLAVEWVLIVEGVHIHVYCYKMLCPL